jgi:DNA gyrase/topoisomerase IV subunit A
MALDKFEQANLKRLEACVKPNEKKIKTLKEKLKKQTEETILKIKELEKANEGFYELIAELKAKEAETEEEVEEESPIVSEEVTVGTVSESGFIELSNEGSIVSVSTSNQAATDTFAAQEDIPY